MRHFLYNFIRLQLQKWQAKLNFNNKMSRQYNQKANSNTPWNWTDQRVQEIMKKYEKPLPQAKNIAERTPLKNRQPNQIEETQRSSGRSPWKNNYYCKPAQQESRQECRTPQNRTFDSFCKENSYERQDTRGIYGKPYEGREKDSSRRMKHGYDYHNQEVPSFYCESYTPSNKPIKDKETELLDAKNYLREQQRKYLKTEIFQIEQDRRQKKPQRESLRSQKTKTELSESPWNDPPRRQTFKDVEYEPRISNIERINNKIKKILQSGKDDRESFNESITQEFKPIQLSIKKPQQTNDSSSTKYYEGRMQQGRSQQTRKIEERSKSCLTLKKTVLPSSELSQKVNDQLAKFSNKISQFEEQKRKLNICFKHNVSKTEERINSSTEALSNKMSFKNDLAEISILCNTQQVREASYQQGEVSPNFQSPYIGLKELDSHIDEPNEDQEVQQITRNIELRRKIMQSQDSPVKQAFSETNSLLSMLSEQVQLDQQLQLAKKWFSNTAQSSDWALLQELLSQRWREMTNEELQSQFMITLEQQDPFYSYRPEQFELEDLVANYIISCRHWCEKVEGQWNISDLRREHCFQKFDRDGKGEVVVEDLVRQINLSQDVFFRNRNVYLVFQRLSQGGRLTQEKMYGVLAKK